MKQVDFFALTRNIQDRFLSSCRGEFDPKPILFRRASRPTGWFWLTLSPLSLLAMWALYRTGLGDMESSLGRHPGAYVAGYVVLAITFAVGIVEWAAHRAAIAGLPFAPGFYVFPACIVDARTTKLGVTPISEVSSVAVVADTVVVKAGPRTLRFPIAAGYGDQALSAIKLAQMQCSDELEATARVLLDPLAPPVVNAPFAPEKALVPRRPLWVKVRLVVAVAFGVVGVVIYQKRDKVSDDAMFAAAKARDDVATYERYLDRGSEHRTTVSRLLLPRAELRLAVADGTVEAIDAFKARYPDTDITEEVEAARRRALEVAFAAAAAPQTFDALLAFDATYPGHHLGQQVAASRRAIYARGLTACKSKLAEKGKTVAVAEQLIAHAEKIGPLPTPAGARGAFVDVRMRAVPSKALAKADALVEKNTYYVGPRSRPTQYLLPDKLQELEAREAQRYVDALGGCFPETVLRFRVGQDMDGAAELPAVDSPTLVISYRLEPSGKNYASAKPRGIFIGVVFFFRVDFLLPGGAEPHVLKHVLPVDVPGRIVIAHADKPDGKLEQKVYDAITAEAFDDVYRRYLAEWLRPEHLPK